MATKNYQWAAAVTVESGGYQGELISIEQNGTEVFSGSINISQLPKTFNLPWTTTTNEAGSSTYTYTYRDSDTMNNNNSTKVAITVTDEWAVSIDKHNVMTVTVHTVMDSAVRTSIGSPSNANRHIWMRRKSNGPDFNPFPLIDNATTAHTIASNVDMGTYTFSLQPGESAQNSTIWWRNTIVGHESDRIPNIYTDIMRVGIHFKNILPKDYVPGKTWTDTSTVVETKTGTNITFNNSIRAPLEDLKVGGDTYQQTYSGKNLLNVIGNSQYGVTGTINSDGSYTISGTANRTDGAKVFSYVGSFPAGTYAFTISQTLPKVINFSITSGVNARITAGNTSATVTTTQAYSGVAVYFGIDNGVSYDITFKMQLVSGSAADYDFEPYVGGTASPNPDYPQEVQTVTGRQVVTISDGDSQSQEYEINLGKNLFYVMDGTGTRGNNTVVARDQTITVNSANNAGTETFWYLNDCSIIQQWADSYADAQDFHTTGDGGEYTLTVTYENMPTAVGVQLFIYTNKRLIRRYSTAVVDGKLVTQISLDSDEHLKSAGIYTATANVFSNFKITAQLEKGSVSTGWAPYFTPIELCKIGTYQDYIYKNEDDWYVHKETTKVTLDGTETITKPFTNIFVVENLSGDWPKESEAVFYYCEDYYRLKSTGSNSNFNTLAANYSYAFDFTSSASGRNIRFKDTRYDNIDNYKTWLASNNVTVYYAIVTPTDTKITNSDLIRQLNVIEAFGTYNGNTIITVSGNITSPLTVSAKVRSNQGVWLSHNRSGGTADIRTGSNTRNQMRTYDGGVGTDNPPTIKWTEEYRNQRLIGDE